MGFPKNLAETAIQRFGTVQSALDSLLAGVVAETSSIADEIYISEGDDDNSDNDFRPNLVAQSTDDKMKCGIILFSIHLFHFRLL